MGSIKPEIRLNVLIYRDKKEWVAHCLEMDLVAVNRDSESVKNVIIDLIKAQFVFAIENKNMDHLFKAAPLKAWEQLKKLKECEILYLNLISEKSKKLFKKTPPIDQVELCLAT